MNKAIVFISHFRIKPGQLDELQGVLTDAAATLEADKPRTLVFLAYLGSDSSRLSIVHVFADAAAMDAHVEGADERSQTAYRYMDADGWEIYGQPSRQVIDMLSAEAEATGVRLDLHPDLGAGFLRLRTS